ncbi:MAG: hypothetical protein COT80_04040 [Candidatus Buchananbacteria bacterium CG10_big_fil_rev_8_21_14_0_10_33_19]|uniref:Uncharacterized protein n=1 Tax=Candidatus Buchananbacteria bacterium CG10_big_fil_rev_8_21_14_0_10_33_19 TaxID=1974525 RepID=A0A2H0W5N2_9BACT|nr:MAG: hypothetical protein COT80_04040 [Candidatus Buchananbacteria bacterium CG10_big_fil_rev_8_21_14_0_10_33_19]
MPMSLRHSHGLQEPGRRDYVNIVLAAFNSFRSITPVGYLSTPITSGQLLYQVLQSYGVKDLNELVAIDEDILIREIITPNALSGIALGDKLARDWKIPIIVPPVFESERWRKYNRDWEEKDYMHIWYQVIREMVGHMIMRNGWHYSNGGVSEFVHAVQLRLRLLPDLSGSSNNTFPKYLPFDLYLDSFAELEIEFPELPMIITDQYGDIITIEAGVELITTAIINLYNRKFKPQKLLVALMHLMGMIYSVNSHLEDGKYEVAGISAPNNCFNMDNINNYWLKAISISGENDREIYQICHS